MSKQLPWVRLYTRTVDDDKLKLLAFEDRWHFIALLCLKGEGLLDKGDAPSLLMRKVAVKLGLDVRSLEEVARRLAEVGLSDHPGGRSAGTQGARVSGAKYGNRRAVSADGLKFDSVAELHRWTHLCILQRASLISDLRRQVVFELVRGVKLAGLRAPGPPFATWRILSTWSMAPK